ncbi:shugoshin-1 isoform X2 [Brachypodium distachyon]|uniref:Shugoshin C-terminal domain-containing protein n=1 Tax=Brachypodium distachyon TaxID=15368 RepID=A0A2K2D500_BRADI|nr:shugoshin-1 isoform X2 [Brachypodium distachyon]PNT69354.1 hypothetical protein BRADI_3g54300v3 [Brachypodium distachyon]PNT69355.1 hypothetical protein BRADI_3g54300v3 [Brachypodium distachyon]|eukprot:XP_010235928.1 shugoshin-1 isoform X2 [Brachypodium distachyon]
MAAAAGAAALGGSSPNPNPSTKGPGSRPAGKPVALADITNTGRPNHPRSVSVGDILKENSKLAHLLAEKTKIIELSGVEIQKLRLALHATHQKNLQLAQANSQILAELNQGKDRLKVLQHELGCATAVLKVKASGLENNMNTVNQLQKEVTSQEIKAAPSELPKGDARRTDNKATTVNMHCSVETQTAVPSNIVHHEAPPDKTKKRTSVSRCTNKEKLESCEGTKGTSTVQQSCKPRLQSTGSSHHEDQRNTLRRRSARLNAGSCELAEVSDETLDEDTAVASSSSCSVTELHEPNCGKDTQKATQDELLCNAAGHKVKTSVLKKNKMNKQTQMEVNLKEVIQEACSSFAGVEDLEARQTDNKVMNTKPNHLVETQSSVPFNIQHTEPPQERANKRGVNKRKLESYEGRKDTNIEDINARLHSTSSEPLHHEETRKSLRRRSSRLNPGSCEVTNDTLETAQDIAPLAAPSSLNVSIEQSKNEKQNDRCACEPSEEQATERRSSVQVTGRRSSMRTSGKAVSYKEIPLNGGLRSLQLPISV